MDPVDAYCRLAPSLRWRVLPATQWKRRFRQAIWNWFYPREQPPSDYDDFMIRLERFLRNSDEFQEKSRRKFERFAPGAAWLAFTDGFCHADLRGQLRSSNNTSSIRRTFFSRKLARSIFGVGCKNLGPWHGRRETPRPSRKARIW